MTPEKTALLELLGLPGALPAEMGRGRGMGPGSIKVETCAIGSDEQLSRWVGIAMEYNHEMIHDLP